jgi:hypothetical protein
MCIFIYLSTYTVYLVKLIYIPIYVCPSVLLAYLYVWPFFKCVHQFYPFSNHCH